MLKANITLAPTLLATPASGAPTYSNVRVAHIDDLGKPFDLKADVYLPQQYR
jgi:hypothetical protein